jgi:hypothetical protein
MLMGEPKGATHLIPKNGYASFMLRLLQVKNNDCPTWVISTQSTKTGELRWFPNLEALVQFLWKEFGDGEGKDHSNPSATRNIETAALADKD